METIVVLDGEWRQKWLSRILRVPDPASQTQTETDRTDNTPCEQHSKQCEWHSNTITMMSWRSMFSTQIHVVLGKNQIQMHSLILTWNLEQTFLWRILTENVIECICIEKSVVSGKEDKVWMTSLTLTWISLWCSDPYVTAVHSGKETDFCRRKLMMRMKEGKRMWTKRTEGKASTITTYEIQAV